MRQKVLIFGYGNPGRLDDGLGPALAERVGRLALEGVTAESNYQLNIEDAENISNYDLVVFADAACDGPEPYSVKSIDPSRGPQFSSHALNPGEVLALCQECTGKRPQALMLAIRGYEFNDFGEKLSSKAEANLEAAVGFAAKICGAGAKELLNYVGG